MVNAVVSCTSDGVGQLGCGTNRREQHWRQNLPASCVSLVLFSSYLMSLSVYFSMTFFSFLPVLTGHTCLSLSLSVCSCRWLMLTTGAALLARWWRSAPTGRTPRRRGLWSWLHRAQEAPLCFSSRVTVACALSSVPSPHLSVHFLSGPNCHPRTD